MRIRVSPDQYSLLQQNVEGKKKNGRTPHVKKRREDLPENIVAGQIKGFLESRGFRVVRQQSGLFARRAYAKRGTEVKTVGMVRVGEVGISDWRAERPAKGILHALFYFEAKAPGERPTEKQILWLDRMRATGTPADWFDGFDRGRKPFLPWYLGFFPDPVAAQLLKKVET